MASETQQRIIDRITAWQANDHVHPLTCGIDSRHRDLVPYVDARVRLKCLDCTWTQDVPSMFGAEADTPSPGAGPLLTEDDVALVRYRACEVDEEAGSLLVDLRGAPSDDSRRDRYNVLVAERNEWDDLAERIGQAIAAIAALQQDRDRLTWLETQIKRDATETFGIYQEDTGVWLMADGRWVDSLRAAIDAARPPGDQPDV